MPKRRAPSQFGGRSDRTVYSTDCRAEPPGSTSPDEARGGRNGMDVQQATGFVIWLTGMNRAGKSSLAANLVSRFAAAGRRVELLDEDGAAAVLLEGLGATKEDHAKAVARLGFVAKA